MTFFHKDSALESVGDGILAATWDAFPGLARNQIAMTWLVYDEPVPVNTGGALNADIFWQHPIRGYQYRGVEPIYPASIVKLFYLVAVYEWLQNNMIASTPELNRAVRDMIVDSSNDATGLVMDLLTGTTSGPDLSPGPFAAWQHQRNIINRYFQSLQWSELESINVNQKTWCDGPYGRERTFLGEFRENRNQLTTNATARLLHAIIGGVAVSPQACNQMMTLLRRSLDPQDLSSDANNQVTGFLGGGLPTDAKIWSKAGLTSQVRHDAAYVERKGQPPFLLVVFTEGKVHSQNELLLPFMTHLIIHGMENMV